MPFGAITRAVLEHHTAQPPRPEDAWYGPWDAIQELTKWHDTIHDLASFNDLQALFQLVAAL